MAKIVNSWNDWDPLKRVIVGRCDNSVIPPEEPATSEKVPVDSEMRGLWGLRPLETVERGNECLENLVKILEAVSYTHRNAHCTFTTNTKAKQSRTGQVAILTLRGAFRGPVMLVWLLGPASF